MIVRSRNIGNAARLCALTWSMTVAVVQASQQLILVPVAPPLVKVQAIDGQASRILCSDAQWLSRPGEPDIPWQVMTILLPPGTVLGSVAVQLQNPTYEAIQGAWTVSAGLPLTQGGASDSSSPKPDPDIYGRDAWWPTESARLLSAGSLRGWLVAQVAVPLVRYNPSGAALERLRMAILAVSFDLDAVSNDVQRFGSDLKTESRLRRIAVNFDQGRAAYGKESVGGKRALRESGDARPGYVIMTTPTIANASGHLSAFVAHKESRGFSTSVVTTDPNDPNWYGVGVAAETIRNWLRSHYAVDQIQYVLLIGNPDPNGADPNDALPMKTLSPAGEVPSDIYYADLTGNWDLDGDGYFGVFPNDFGPGGVDRNWEVAVGRIPIHTSDANWVTDLDSILLKTIAYQNADPNTLSWRRRVLLPMMPISKTTPAYQLGEQIKDDILVPEGWGYHRCYEHEYGLIPPPETIDTTVEKVTAVWSTCNFGLVVWWTHGKPWGAADVMDLEHVALLDNGHPVFTFQAACSNSDPETVHNLSFDLLRNGAVCTIGATRPSFYSSGQIHFAGTTTSAGMAYEYTARMVYGRLSAGEAIGELKQVLTPTMAVQWSNFALFNIYGDPEVHLFPPESFMDDVHNETQGLWYNRVQDAVDEANGGDVIVLQPVTYTGTGNRDIDFGGKAITLRSTNPQDPNVVAATVLDLSHAGRGFNFHSGEGPNALVLGLTITHGSANVGAGIYCLGSSPTIRNCRIVENSAASNGGGICSEANSNPTLEGCTIEGNTAGQHAGGLFCADSSPTVFDCSISGNSAGGFGGGIVCYTASNPTITDCKIMGNSSGLHAGAICCYGNSSPSVISSVFTNNRTNGVGGAIYCHSNSNPTFRHCTIADNIATSFGGAIHGFQGSQAAIDHCILWGDTAAQGPEIALRNSSTLTVAFCDVQGGPNQVYAEDANWLVWLDGNLDQDPQFVDPLGPDGDPNTWTDNDYHIIEGSPCAEAGDPSRSFLGELDIDLESRMMGKRVDIGADESAAYYTKCGTCGEGAQPLAPMAMLSITWLARRRR